MESRQYVLVELAEYRRLVNVESAFYKLKGAHKAEEKVQEEKDQKEKGAAFMKGSGLPAIHGPPISKFVPQVHTPTPAPNVETKVFDRIRPEQFAPLLPKRFYQKIRNILFKLNWDPSFVISPSGEVFLNGKKLIGANGMALLMKFVKPSARKTELLCGEKEFNQALEERNCGSGKGKIRETKKPWYNFRLEAISNGLIRS